MEQARTLWLATFVDRSSGATVTTPMLATDSEADVDKYIATFPDEQRRSMSKMPVLYQWGDAFAATLDEMNRMNAVAGQVENYDPALEIGAALNE